MALNFNTVNIIILNLTTGAKSDLRSKKKGLVNCDIQGLDHSGAESVSGSENVPLQLCVVRKLCLCVCVFEKSQILCVFETFILLTAGFFTIHTHTAIPTSPESIL